MPFKGTPTERLSVPVGIVEGNFLMGWCPWGHLCRLHHCGFFRHLLGGFAGEQEKLSFCLFLV